MIIKKNRYEILDSTNNKARELAFNSAPEGTLVIADMQTEGKGRHGRSWDATEGKDIMMSMILRPDIALESYSMITLITALAVSSALGKTCTLKTRIKWPNDIVYENKKICGILTESVFNGMSGFVIVGIGVNVNSTAFANAIKDKAGSLKIFTGREWDKDEIVDAIWKDFERYYNVLKRDGDLRNLVDEYNAVTINYNSPIRRTDYNNEEPVSGVAMGINCQGWLVVISDDGTEKLLYSGEIQ